VTATLAVSLGSLLRPALPFPLRAGVVIAVALFVLAGEWGWHRIRLPYRRAQVPATVVGAGAQAGALQFGFEMGSGVRTHLPSNLPYLPLAAILLVGNWVAAVLAGLGFGLGRAAMALGHHLSPDPASWDEQWRHREVPLRRALALVATLLALAAVLG
jgi:hypothetical protein